MNQDVIRFFQYSNWSQEMKDTYKTNPYYVIYKFSEYGNSHYYAIAFSKNPFISMQATFGKGLQITYPDRGNNDYINTNLCYGSNINYLKPLWRDDLFFVLGGDCSLAYAHDFITGVTYCDYYFSSHAISGLELKPFPYELSDSAADNPVIIYPDVIPVDKVPEKVITNPDDSIPLDLDKVYLPDGTLDKGYVDSVVGEAVLNPPVEEDKPSDTFPWVPDIANPIKGILGLLGQLLEYLRGILQKLLDGTLAIPGFLSSILEFVIDICDAIIAFPATLEKLLMDLLDFAGIIAAIDAIAAFFVIDFSLVLAEIAPLQAELTGKFSDITGIINLFSNLRAGNKVEAPSFTLTIPSVMGLGEIVIPFNFSRYSKAMETVRSVESVLFWFWFALAMFSMIRVRFHVD